EMAALGRFYTDVTWKGTIHEGGMGPGTPAMTGVGRGKVQAIQDGRWIVLDCEQDQFLPDGTFVLRWQLHWVSGWSPEHGEYRAARSCWGHGGPGQEDAEVEMLGNRLGAAVMLVGGAALVYFGFLRDWHLHWGATAREAGGEVAGDELMPEPDIVATRVVEID